MSLGDEVRTYVRQKFGEHETGKILISHHSLRYVITDFVIRWQNTRGESFEDKTAPTESSNGGKDEH